MQEGTVLKRIMFNEICLVCIIFYLNQSGNFLNIRLIADGALKNTDF
jgi:hypothetical protein